MKLLNIIITVLLFANIASGEEIKVKSGSQNRIIINYSNGKTWVAYDYFQNTNTKDAKNKHAASEMVSNISVYPNPVLNGQATISFNLSDNSGVCIYGFNLNNEKIKIYDGFAQKGINSMHLNLSGFEDGVVGIYVEADKIMHKTKIIIL